jgi:transposase InsO family protein
MRFHCNSKTHLYIRSHIKQSPDSYRDLARTYGISLSTVHRWKHSQQQEDRSSRPVNVRQAMCPQARTMALQLRKKGLTLDECLDSLRPLFPKLARATLHRFLVREGLGNLKPAKSPSKNFKSYEPGFIHIDSFQLPTLGGKKRYCYLAIDRATRISTLEIYESRDQGIGVDFLGKALQFFPFLIHRVLTDNGGEFTNRHYKPKQGGPKRLHPFALLCLERGISHRLIAPYTPRTNGMVERMVQTTKNATTLKYTYSSPHEMITSLHHWMRTYNQYRKHSAIGRRTPEQELHRWYKDKPELFTREPASSPKVFSTY